jgi:hypothetical protein
VYEVARAHVEARDLYRGIEKDAEEEQALRKWVFASAGADRLDFDMLCDKVLARIEPR